MNITAYIPCYNGERYLAATIQALLIQTRRPDEIIIIDDGSTDSTFEIASSFPVRVIRHNSNKGLAAARNTAFKNAKFPFVAAIDADAVPERSCLEFLAENFEDERVAAVGGRLIEEHCDTTADRWHSLHLRNDCGTVRIKATWPSRYLMGGFGYLMRKSALEHVGGFDERFRTAYEDCDISRRLLLAGYRLVHEPRSIFRHMRRDTIYSVIRTAWSWYFWMHFYRGSYQKILPKVYANFLGGARLGLHHWKEGLINLWSIDSLVPFFHSYWDLRYYFSSQNVSPPPMSKDLGEVLSPPFWSPVPE